MNTQQSSKVNPGYGYRFLDEGERVVEGDEYYSKASGVWRPSRLRGSHRMDAVIEHRRRKVETPKTIFTPPAGYRLLLGHEKIIKGDVFVSRSDSPARLTEAYCASEVGATVTEAYTGTDRLEAYSSDVVFLRKVEVAKAAPRSPQGTPPAGYRWLVEGEVVGPFDRVFANGTQSAHLDAIDWLGKVVGESAGDLGEYPFIRALPVTAASVMDAQERLSNQAATIRSYQKELAETKASLESQRAQILRIQSDLENTKRAYASLRSALKTPANTDVVCHAISLVTKLEAMQKNASGNAVMVRKDGYSLPTTLKDLSPGTILEFDAGTMWKGGASHVYHSTGTKDGFGRTVFKEAA